MVLENISYSHASKNVILMSSSSKIIKIFIISLSVLSFSFILESIQNFSKVNAQNSLGQTVQQFNNNLRSGIDKQIQSNLNQGALPNINDNSINCNGTDNFVTHSQTTNNGQATFATKSDCNGTTNVPSPIESQR
jgi:hypothetical protein